MKKSIVTLISVCILLLFVNVLFSKEGKQWKNMDNEEIIKRIAKKHDISVEEARKLLGQKRGGKGGGKGKEGEFRERMKKFQDNSKSGMDNAIAVTTTDKYLFVIKGNYIYQYNINTLKLKNKVAIDEEKEKKKSYIKDRVKKRLEDAKRRIQELREQGNVEEAEELEAKLKQLQENAKKMRDRGKGKGKGRGKEILEEVKPNDEVIF